VITTVYLNDSLGTAVLIISYIFLFYLAISVAGPRTRVYVHFGIIAVSFITSSIILAQIFLKKIPAATFPNKNLAAGYVSYGAALLFAKLFLEERPFRQRAAMAFCFLFFIAAIFATGSRGGLLSAVCGMAFVAHIKYRKWGLISFFVILLALFVVTPEGRLAGMAKISGGDSYAVARPKIWMSAVEIIKERPLTGTGPGNFGLLFFKHRFEGTTSVARYGKITRFAHNEFLQAAAECGIFCLIFFVWIWVVIFRSYRYSVASSAALTAVAAHSLFDFNFHLPAVSVMTVLLAADVLSVRARDSGYTRSGRRYAVAVPAALAVLNAVLFAVRPFDAERYKLKGDKLIAADPRAALGFYKEAVKRSPNNYEYSQTAGELSYMTGDREAALRYLEKSVMLNPKNSFACKSLGQYYFNDGKFMIAEFYFLKALETEPNYLWARYYLARSYEKLDRPDSAMAEYTNVLDINRAFASLTALSSYEKSLLSIDMSAVYDSVGLLDIRLGDRKGAIAMFVEALDLKPASAEIHSDIASAYYLSGDYRAALGHAELAAELEKNNPQHIRNLMLVYEKLGDTRAAAALKKELGTLAGSSEEKK